MGWTMDRSTDCLCTEAGVAPPSPLRFTPSFLSRVESGFFPSSTPVELCTQARRYLHVILSTSTPPPLLGRIRTHDRWVTTHSARQKTSYLRSCVIPVLVYTDDAWYGNYSPRSNKIQWLSAAEALHVGSLGLYFCGYFLSDT